MRVVRSSDNWVGGDESFTVRRGSNATGDGGPYNSSNPFVPNHPQAGNNFVSSGITLQVTGIEKVQKPADARKAITTKCLVTQRART